MKNNAGFIVFLAILLCGVSYLVLSNLNSELEPSVVRRANAIYGVDTIVFNTAEQTPKTNALRHRYRVLNIELNQATQDELKSVYGIGEVLSARIIEYRERLGGYYSVQQLMEVRGIDKKVFGDVSKNFFVDSNKISKISINFASQNELLSHPYFTPSMVKRVEKAKLKGGYFTNTQELIDKDILLSTEAQKVAPYLLFQSGEAPQ